jgi:hypothetical protein
VKVITFTFNENDPTRAPAFQALREWSHRQGLSQGQVSEMLGLYASAESSRDIAIANAAKREREALGANGPIRIDAVSNWLTAKYPAAAQTMIRTLVTAKQLAAFEDIISRLTNQGGSSYSRRGGEPDKTGIDDATWDKMSYGEKKEYAERSSAQNGGRR